MEQRLYLHRLWWMWQQTNYYIIFCFCTISYISSRIRPDGKLESLTIHRKYVSIRVQRKRVPAHKSIFFLNVESPLRKVRQSVKILNKGKHSWICVFCYLDWLSFKCLSARTESYWERISKRSCTISYSRTRILCTIGIERRNWISYQNFIIAVNNEHIQNYRILLWYYE